MIDAADEEAKLAIERGHIFKGIPYIPVEVDGSYIKRSFGSKYNSLSGVGVIVGQYTKKVLYIGVCHKYCSICEMSRRKNISAPSHTCRSNFAMSDPSTKMESQAIVEGFQCSVELHGLIYKLVVSDGDCNVYKSIMDAIPYADYDLVPEKIYCTNHLLRNLCRKLYVTSETKLAKGVRNPKFIAARKIVGNNIMKIRHEIVYCVKRWQQKDMLFKEKVNGLRKDIYLVTSHVFGDHRKCRDCDFSIEKDSENHVPELERHGLYQKVEEAVEYLNKYCDSLLYGFTTNMAESFHALVCKTLGGKRVNFSHENQYKSRTAAAAVQHNTQMALTSFYVTMDKRVPEVLASLEQERIDKVKKTGIYRNENSRNRRRRFQTNDGFYGERCQKDDLSPETMEQLKSKHFQRLDENQKKRQQIQEETVDQNQSNYWMALRKSMLTASNFGKICNMRPHTSSANAVKSILYGIEHTTEAMKYGSKMESTARDELSKIINKKIESCGLFIDAEYSYLEASPDGLIDEDGIVEIKCPHTTSKEDIEKKEHLKKFISISTKEMKRKHIYHFQVQGQLHITQRQYCIFAVYTEYALDFIRVERDDVFWKNEMEQKLIKFYINCMLPEILDSRHLRNMKIRDPDYIVEAKKSKLMRKTDDSQTEDDEVEICTADDNNSCSSENVNEDGVNYSSENIRDRYIHLNYEITLDSIDDIIKNVLPTNSLLDDLSIDTFLKIIKDTTIFKPQSVQSIYAIHSVESETARSIQIIGGNCTNHWRCAYFDGDQIEIYDSMWSENRKLSDVEIEYLRKRFPRSERITFIKMLTTQPDSYSCGVYAAAFATDLAMEKDPSKCRYSNKASDMRKHFIKILQEKKLTHFPLQ